MARGSSSNVRRGRGNSLRRLVEAALQTRAEEANMLSQIVPVSDPPSEHDTRNSRFISELSSRTDGVLQACGFTQAVIF